MAISAGVLSPLRILVLAAMLFLTAAAQEVDVSVLHKAEEATPGPSGTNGTTTATTASETPSVSALTTVISIFYMDEGAYEGLPYTAFHRDSGAVIGAGAEAATFVITTTRTDMRPPPTHPRTDNVTTGIPTLRPHPPETGPGPGSGNTTGTTPSSPWWAGVGDPSTVTQGPSTFLFTGTRAGFGGPDHTVVNRCRLLTDGNGTAAAAAACNLTHVGAVWYTAEDPAWNGTCSTYSYNWTGGDRFGFAPVTVTLGVERLAAVATSAAATASANAAEGRRRGEGRGAGGFGWLGVGVGTVLPAVVLAVAVLL